MIRRLLTIFVLAHFPACVLAQTSKPERVVIDTNLPGGYQVEVGDVNGDGKIDVIALGGSTCAWYENPSWKKHVVTSGKDSAGIISSGTADIDGDGRAEIAIAYEFSMNQPKKGKLLLATQSDTSGDKWTLKHIDDIGSIHRLRWADVDGDGKRDLVVGPIFGPNASPPLFDQDPATTVVYRMKNGWKAEPVGKHLISHAIDALDIDGDGRAEILTACTEGVVAHWFDTATQRFTSRVLAPGKPGKAPKTGSSEVHVGKLRDGSRFVASIDPWHGTEVGVYHPISVQKDGTANGAKRHVLDTTLEDGHALWVADVDGDGDDEVFAGHRGKDHRVSMYDFDGMKWNRTVLDSGVAAQDLRGADFDGDGRPDVVAVGGKTGNVVMYRWPKP
jgi:hypothetical protein